ncbi:MAG TPA: tyrosine-type recombinase/integrase [Casimicrobiaceae bacterium]|nr:tyrosine-type recombinase/integrase [Casimicrobiaceae bacterium]
MALTDTAVRNAKPKIRPYKLADGDGMYLLVQPSGAKYWRWKYRYAGREKLLALGVYPITRLADARTARDAARRQLKDDIDPGAARKAKKAEARLRGKNTFEAIAREWHGKMVDVWSPSHAGAVMASLEENIFPDLGRQPIAEITAPELLVTLRKMERREALEQARKVKQRCGMIFRYAVASGLAERDPSQDLRGALKTRKASHYPAIPFAELPAFIDAIDQSGATQQTRLAIDALLYCFVRTNELRGARWDELDFKDAVWRIPAARMKMAEQHLVPLSRQTLAVFKQLRELNGRGPLVFPNQADHSKPMSENTVLYAIHDAGYKGRMCGHGFRHLASTTLNEAGFRSDVIERQLAHSDGNKVRAAYNHAQHLPERKRMMQAWADMVDAARDGATVIPGRFGKAA